MRFHVWYWNKGVHVYVVTRTTTKEALKEFRSRRLGAVLEIFSK